MPATYSDRLNGLTTSVAVKAPCRCGTTGPITLSGLQTVDGTVLVALDRVLVKDQTNAVDNGIWLAGTGQWTRSEDFDGARDAVKGTLVSVLGGTDNGGIWFQLNTDDPVVIGVDEIEWIVSLLIDRIDTATEEAEDAADRAEAAAAGLNLPPLSANNAGSSLIVNEDGNGYTLLGGPSALRNLILNGDAIIDTIDSDTTPVAGSAGGVQGPDRWYAYAADGLGGGGGYTIEKDTVGAPPGFRSCLKVVVTSPNPSPIAAAYYVVSATIPAVNCRHLDFGLATAKTVCVRLLIKSTLAGLYPVTLRNGAFNRSFVSVISIAQANVWEEHYVAIPGDIAGTWATTGVGDGLQVSIDLGSGTGQQDTAGAWIAGNKFSVAGRANFITGGSTLRVVADLFVGSIPQKAFENRPVALERLLLGLPIDPALLSAVTPAVDDRVLVYDTSDVNRPKTVTPLQLAGRSPRAFYSNTQTAGTNGGGSTAAAWTTCTLNTEDSDPDGIGTLASSQVTLPAGTYIFEGKQQVSKTNGALNARLRIRNITDGTTAALGVNACSSDTGTDGMVLSVDSGPVTIAGSKAFALQYWVDSAQTTTGLGIAMSTGETEKYAQLGITRIA